MACQYRRADNPEQQASRLTDKAPAGRFDDGRLANGSNAMTKAHDGCFEAILNNLDALVYVADMESHELRSAATGWNTAADPGGRAYPQRAPV